MNNYILSFTVLFFSFFNLTGCAYLRAKMDAFRLPPPTLQITSVSPTFSKTLGQTLITLRGTLFQKGLRVEIGKNNCESLKVLSDTELNCLAPASPKATVNISVINPDGKTAVLTDSFIYSDQLMSPSISGFMPTNGSTNGSTLLIISGSQFRTGTSVTIGEKPCLSLTVTSASTMTCLTPPGSLGPVKISVTSPEGPTASLNSKYTYSQPETYTALKAEVLTNRCSQCHGNSGGFSTQSYSEILSKVSPGNPAGSLLYQQVANNYMPRNGEPLTPAEKQKIFDWIVDGAKNN